MTRSAQSTLPEPVTAEHDAAAASPRATPTAPIRAPGLARHLRRLAAVLRSRRGVASMEFALIGGLVLLPIMAGTVDYGLVLTSYAGATRAQQAAFMAALEGASFSSIQSAATTAYGSGSPQVTVSTAWYCAPSAQSWTHSGTSYSTEPNCPAGYLATQYMTVAVAATVSLPVPLPGVQSPYPVTSTTTVRIQ